MAAAVKAADGFWAIHNQANRVNSIAVPTGYSSPGDTVTLVLEMIMCVLVFLGGLGFILWGCLTRMSDY